jgi:sRNA-binding regulator protein Hfq
MNNKTKLLLSLQQIDNLTSLLKDNEYQQFLYGHLISLEVELERQLSNYGKATD